MNNLARTNYGETAVFAKEKDFQDKDKLHNWIWEILEGESSITDDGIKYLCEQIGRNNFVERFLAEYPHAESNIDFRDFCDGVFKSDKEMIA